jgi:thioredoxin 2
MSVKALACAKHSFPFARFGKLACPAHFISSARTAIRSIVYRDSDWARPQRSVGRAICPLFERRPFELNDTARFDKHAGKSHLPLLVDFSAAWCGPCRSMAPIFEKAAAELEAEIRLAKVDSDAAPELLRRFHVQSLSTLLLVHRGQEIARKSGLLSLPALLAWVPKPWQY